MNKVLRHSRSLNLTMTLKVGCYSHFTDAELRLREIKSPVQDHTANELYCPEVARSDVSEACAPSPMPRSPSGPGSCICHTISKRPRSCPLEGNTQAGEGISARRHQPAGTPVVGSRSTERPVHQRANPAPSPSLEHLNLPLTFRRCSPGNLIKTVCQLCS